ncbi:MAG: tagatose 3-epimerase [Isosphaeraceae bacterium]|jgi:sugar phosphate isomerase/epimerase|nr:MAG: tagatose 3-epimerase [Isosphaeraceae bacterium]
MIRLGLCNELFEGWELSRTCSVVAALGYEGLELAPFTLASRITDLSIGRRQEIRRTIEESGLATIGLHWLLARTEGLHLTSPDEATRKRTAAYLIALAEATAEMGGSLMVLGSPKQRNLLPGVTLHQAYDYAALVLDAAMPAIGSVGVKLCLEPLAPAETDFINSIADAQTLIDRIGHPALRLHLDVKAMSADPGGSMTELIARYGREAAHFHAQDPGDLRGPGMGETDFGPIVRALVASGYQGWISVEPFDYSMGAERTARESLECLKRELHAAKSRTGVERAT